MRYWALVTAATSWSVLHTIVYDWSRDTHNRSIGAADADLSAAAKLATYSAACIALTVAFRRRSLIVEMTGPILGHGSSVGLVYQYRGITPDGGRL